MNNYLRNEEGKKRTEGEKGTSFCSANEVKRWAKYECAFFGWGRLGEPF